MPEHAPTALEARQAQELAGELNRLLADAFALYVETKSLEWCLTGPAYEPCRQLLASQEAEIIGMTDPLAEQVQALGAIPVHSVGELQGASALAGGGAPDATPNEWLKALIEDNRRLVRALHRVLAQSERLGDPAFNTRLESWIDAGDRRALSLTRFLRTLEPVPLAPAPTPRPAAAPAAPVEAGPPVLANPLEPPPDAFLEERAEVNDMPHTGVHPRAVALVGICYAAMMLAAWVIFYNPYAGLYLGFATLICLMFFGIFIGGALNADEPPRGEHNRDFGAFLHGKVMTWDGSLPGREAFLQLAFLPACLLAGFILIGAVFVASAPHGGGY